VNNQNYSFKSKTNACQFLTVHSLSRLATWLKQDAKLFTKSICNKANSEIKSFYMRGMHIQVPSL